MKKVTFILFALFLGLMMTAQENKTEQTPELKDVDGFHLATMPFTGSFTQMEKNIAVFMGEFFKQGLQPAGPFMGVYFNSPQEVKEEELKWELAFPVAKDAVVKESLMVRDLPKTKAVVYLYIGPYENMDKAYDKVFKFAEKNGCEIVWPCYDKYLNNPMEVKPEDLKTEIIVPVKKKL
jgi:AraC family transcriptional regulator